MDLELLLPLVLVCLAIAGALFVLLTRMDEKQVVRESLRQIDDYDMDGAPPNLRADALAESIGTRAIIPALAKLTATGRRFTPMGYADKVRQKFVHAGIQTPDSVDRFLAAKAVLVPLGATFTITSLLAAFSMLAAAPTKRR